MYNLIEKIINRSSRYARGISGPERLEENERELTQYNWQEIEKKHGFSERDVNKLSNYDFKSLVDYLNLQEETEGVFNQMVKEKKQDGKTEKYIELKQEWEKKKGLLETFHLSDDKEPSEIAVGDEISLPPDEFIRKYNLGTLNMKHRNFLLDILTSKYRGRRQWQRRESAKKAEVESSEKKEEKIKQEPVEA